MFLELEVLSLILCASFLTFGAWSDLKTREVSNRLWVASLPVAASLTTARILLSPDLIFSYTTSILISMVMALGIYAGGLYGGADAKATITLAVAMPLFPKMFTPRLGYYHPCFPLIVFTNSLLLSLSGVIYVMARNLTSRIRTRRPLFQGLEHEPLLKKVLVFFSGYKLASTDLRDGRHLITLETVENGQRKLWGLTDILKTDESAPSARSGDEVFQRAVWVTPSLPMLVFVLAGFIITLLAGDVPLYLVSSLFA